MDTKRFPADNSRIDQQNRGLASSARQDLLDRLESVFPFGSESASIPTELKHWDNWNDPENSPEPKSPSESPCAAGRDLGFTENDNFSDSDFDDLWNRSLSVNELSLPYAQSIAAVADNRLAHQELRQKLKTEQVKRLATIPINFDFEQSELPEGVSQVQPVPAACKSSDSILPFTENQTSAITVNDGETNTTIEDSDEQPPVLEDSQADPDPSPSESAVSAAFNPEVILPIDERVETQDNSTPELKPYREQEPLSTPEFQNTAQSEVVKPKRKRSALRWSIVIGLTALFVGLVLFGRETYPRYLLLSGMKNVTNLKIQAGTIQEDYQRGTTSVSPVLVNDNLNQPLLKVKSASFSSLPVLLWKEDRLDWIVLDGIEFCGAAIRRPVDLPGLKGSPLQAEYSLNLAKAFQPFVGTELRNLAQERMKTLDQEVSRLTEQLGEEFLLIQGNVKQLQETVSPDSNSLPGLVQTNEKSLSPEAAVQRSVEIRSQLKEALTQWRDAKDRWSRQAENLLDDKNFSMEPATAKSGLQLAENATSGVKAEEECLLPGLPDDLQTGGNTADNQPSADLTAKLACVEQPVGAKAKTEGVSTETVFQPQPQLFNEYLFGAVYKPFLNQFYQEIIGFTQWLPALQNALKESDSVGKTKETIPPQLGAKNPTINGLFASPVEISQDLSIGQIRLSGQIKFLGENQPFTGIVSNLNSRTPSRPTVVDLTFNSRYPSRLRLVVIPLSNDKQKITVEYYRPESTLIPQIGRPNGICLSCFRQKAQSDAEQSASESTKPIRTDSVQMEIVDGKLKGEYRCVQNNIACELFIPGICSDEGLQKIHFLGARISGFELTAQLSGSLVSPQLSCWSNIESLETGAQQIAQAELELQRQRFVQTLKSEWTEPLQKIADRIGETQKKLESTVLVNRVVLDQTVQLCQSQLEQQKQEQSPPAKTDGAETAEETPPTIPDLSEQPTLTEEELSLEQSQSEGAGAETAQSPSSAPAPIVPPVAPAIAPANTDYYQNQNPQTAEKLNSDNPLR